MVHLATRKIGACNGSDASKDVGCPVLSTCWSLSDHAAVKLECVRLTTDLTNRLHIRFPLRCSLGGGYTCANILHGKRKSLICTAC
jgi:hypothetical protein